MLVERWPRLPALCEQLDPDTLHDAAVFISDNRQCGTGVQREMHEVSSLTTWLSVGSQGEAGRGGRPTKEGGRQRGDLAHCERRRMEGRRAFLIPHPFGIPGQDIEERNLCTEGALRHSITSTAVLQKCIALISS